MDVYTLGLEQNQHGVERVDHRAEEQIDEYQVDYQQTGAGALIFLSEEDA